MQGNAMVRVKVRVDMFKTIGLAPMALLQHQGATAHVQDRWLAKHVPLDEPSAVAGATAGEATGTAAVHRCGGLSTATAAVVVAVEV